jgi:hypothetical protein
VTVPSTQSNFLIPTTNWFNVAIALVIIGLCSWALIESAARGRWGWFWATLCTGPFAGAAWLVAGRWQRPTE